MVGRVEMLERGGIRSVLVLLVVVFASGAGIALASTGPAPGEANIPLPPDASRPSDSTWVATDPLQCVMTPWEQEWWDTHGGDMSSYPRGLEGERGVIVDFFARRGISVLDFEAEISTDPRLTVCGAERGYTIFLLVHDADVDAMLTFGFRVVDR